MSYEITKEDFCLIVKNPKCQGTETENGTAKQGHEQCTACKGNYFVGGECNYGGNHKLDNDLDQINRNFRAFDILVKQQAKLSKSKNEQEFNQIKRTLVNSFNSLKAKCEENNGESFFYGSCVGIDGSKSDFAERIKETFKRLAKELGHYIQQVEKTTWQQLHEFQVKLKKLDKLNSESIQLTKDWKKEQDPIKKQQLFVLLSQKQQAIRSLQLEIQQDPTFAIFSQEKSDELANIVQNIFQGDGKKSFFDWQAKEKEEAEETPSDKYFGLLPKESTNNVLIFISGCLAIGFIYNFYQSKFKN